VTDADERPMKALYDHCITVFDEMFKEAEPEEQSENNYEGGPNMDQRQTVTTPTGYMIWTGHTTQLFARLGMATPYYTTVMQALKKMSCVEQVKRGGGNSMSKWRLVRRPEEEFFEAAEKLKKPVQGGQKALEQQVRDLNKRVSDVESLLHDVVQNLPPMENVA
jgi:hypothetical protein